MGQRPLHEILSERESISQHMKALLDEATDSWGINVERVEMCVSSRRTFIFYFIFFYIIYFIFYIYRKDVRLPVQLQRAMAAEAEAAREARAKVIAAEGEQKASRALREASEVIGDSPAALQLRYLQVSLYYYCSFVIITLIDTFPHVLFVFKAFYKRLIHTLFPIKLFFF